jgi:hypothetical protein
MSELPISLCRIRALALSSDLVDPRSILHLIVAGINVAKARFRVVERSGSVIMLVHTVMKEG